jgi:hypothetical protein
MELIQERYKWLVDLFIKEFGEENIITNSFNLGNGFAIGVKCKDKIQAVKVEYREYEKKWNEEGDNYQLGNLISEYSLNDDPNKYNRAKEIILSIKEKLK